MSSASPAVDRLTRLVAVGWDRIQTRWHPRNTTDPGGNLLRQRTEAAGRHCPRKPSLCKRIHDVVGFWCGLPVRGAGVGRQMKPLKTEQLQHIRSKYRKFGQKIFRVRRD